MEKIGIDHLKEAVKNSAETTLKAIKAFEDSKVNIWEAISLATSSTKTGRSVVKNWSDIREETLDLSEDERDQLISVVKIVFAQGGYPIPEDYIELADAIVDGVFCNIKATSRIISAIKKIKNG